MKIKMTFTTLCGFIMLAACIGTTVEPTQAPAPTVAAQTDSPATEPPLTEPPPTFPPPTEPPPNAVPPTATPTALPQGVLFFDDFNGALQPGWTWVDEDPFRWSFIESAGQNWLQITAGDASFFKEGYQVNMLARDLPEGEFAITAHLVANPTENFQQAHIFIFEDAKNYILLNIGFCNLCPVDGGFGFFMENFYGGARIDQAYSLPRQAGATDVYLRLVNQNGMLTGYYATSPDDWQRAGRFGNYFDFTKVGLGATNANPEGVLNDLMARFDWFEISLWPAMSGNG